MRIAVGAEENRAEVVVLQGEADRKRTHKEGCVLAAKTTGEGDMDTMDRINAISRYIFLGQVHLVTNC